VDETDISTIRK